MSAFGLDCEYAPLTAVLLYKPSPAIAAHPDPARIQHNAPIDHTILSRELDILIALYHSLQIKVQLIPQPDDPSDVSNFNMMFCRDLLFMTPAGAVLANMANATRCGETAHAARTLDRAGIPLLGVISGEGRFEGADALWIHKDLVAVGVGNRTNLEGYQQLKTILAEIGIETVSLPSTQQTTQHLLGSVQIVARDLAFIRTELVASEGVSFLAGHGFRIVAVPENSEVRCRQAMNIVTIAPAKIIMTTACPETRQLYESAGVDVVAELSISQLINGAGGLACATGTLARNCS